MAEETANQSATSKSSGDEVIDLEGLVRDIDKTPTDGIGASASSGSMSDDFTPPPPIASGPLHADALSHDKIDELLIAEDPTMADQLASIRELGTAKDAAAIRSLDQEDAAVNKAMRGHGRISFRDLGGLYLLRLRRLFRAIRDLVIRGAKDFKGVLREVGIRTKVYLVAGLHNRKAEITTVLNWFKARSLGQKFSLVMAIAILAGVVFVAKKTLKGTLLPKTELVWIATFADHADEVFKYKADDPTEDFNDPLLHPEFVILIERVVVNLTRTESAKDGSNPMAAFELYLQTDNQETAIEIKDRNVEIRDALSRSVERMSYPDLVDEEGKTKLKLLIRKDLNEVLTKGKIRRVFFKTLVLNPE